MEFLFWFALASAIFWQFEDCHTTEQALAAGFVEANPVARWLISKVGIGLSYPIKCIGVANGIPLALFFAAGQTAGIVAAFAVAALGAVAAITNAKKLVANKTVKSILAALF